MSQQKNKRPKTESKPRPAKSAPQGFIDKLVAGWRPVYLLAGLVLVVYLRTLSFDLVGLDDAQLIGQADSQIQSLSGALSSFTESAYVDFYRPGLILSLYLMRLLGGNSPAFYHFCCILLHALACCLAWLVLLRLGVDRWPALLLSAFLAVHPLATQAVAWIMGCNDTLLTVLVLGSFLFLLQAGGPRYALSTTLHLACFAAALLVKETAVALPAISVIYWLLLKEQRPSIRKCSYLAAGWVLIAIAWFGLRSQALAHMPMGQQRYTSMANLGNMLQNLQALPEMFGQLLLPFRLSVYPTFSTIALIAGLAALALCAAIIWITPGKNGRLIGLGACWFALFLLPTLFFRQQYADSGYDYLNHRIYISAFGFLLIAAELHRAWLVQKGRNFARLFNRTMLIVLAVLAAVTVRYSGAFENRLSFWENAARTSPGSSRAHGAYGQALLRYARDLQKAEPHLRTAVELESSGPRHLTLMNNLAGVYSQTGRQSEAVALWKEILSTTQRFPGEENVPNQAVANLMLYYLQEKNLPEARKYYDDLKRRGINVDAEFPDAAKQLENLP